MKCTALILSAILALFVESFSADTVSSATDLCKQVAEKMSSNIQESIKGVTSMDQLQELVTKSVSSCQESVQEALKVVSVDQLSESVSGLLSSSLSQCGSVVQQIQQFSKVPTSFFGGTSQLKSLTPILSKAFQSVCSV